MVRVVSPQPDKKASGISVNLLRKKYRARVVELVDTLVLEASAESLEVRVLSRAPFFSNELNYLRGLSNE